MVDLETLTAIGAAAIALFVLWAFLSAGMGRWAIFLGLTVAAALLWWAHYNPAVAMYGDNADFILLGRELASGASGPPSRYPIGFPALLAAVHLVAPAKLWACKALVGLFYVAVPWFTYLLTKDE